jgi:hypothetical protein
MSVDEYYEMKNKYEFETKTNKARKKIIKNDELSMKEKRTRLQSLKSKCVSCQRPVGTIFKSIFETDNESRILTARCGDKISPCELDIRVNPGSYISIKHVIDFYENENEKIKQKVINIKNRTLFGFSTNESAVEEYNKIKEDINTNSYLLDKFLSLYNDSVDNKERNNNLRIKFESLYQNINVYKEHIDKYRETRNELNINESIDIYEKQITPLLKEIMKLKYENCMIFKESKKNNDEDDENNAGDGDTGKTIYHLLQDKYTNESMEFNDLAPEIISWRISEK